MAKSKIDETQLILLIVVCASITSSILIICFFVFLSIKFSMFDGILICFHLISW